MLGHEFASCATCPCLLPTYVALSTQLLLSKARAEYRLPRSISLAHAVPPYLPVFLSLETSHSSARALVSASCTEVGEK